MKRGLLALPLAVALACLLLALWMKRPGPATPPTPGPPAAQGKDPHQDPPFPGPSPRKAETSPLAAALPGSVLLRITGRGSPLPDAEVLLKHEDREDLMRFRTGPDGTRLILQIPAGHYVASVSQPRFLAGEVHVEVPAGARAVAALDLQPGARIFGRVSDRSGASLPDTNIEVVDDASRMGAGTHLSTKTDAGGRFELTPVPPGDWGLRLRHPRFKIHDHRGLAVRTGAEEFEVNVTLEVGARVVGRVLDEQGTPISGATIVFGNEGGGGLAKSDAEGRFTVYGLTEAPVSGSASLKGYGTAYRRGLPPNGPEIEFRLSKGGILTGRLVTESLPEHYTVTLSRFDPELGKPLRIHQKPFSAATSQGNFSVEDLAPGTYWVEVECDGYETAEQPQVTIAAGQTSAPLTIRMNRK